MRARPRSRPFGAALGAAVFLATAATAAAAADSPRVTIDALSCPELDLEEVRRIAAIELTATFEGGGASSTESAVAQVRVECEPETTRIVVRDSLTAKNVERYLSLESVEPRARPRILAIAITELLNASWAELATTETPPPNDAAAPARDAVRQQLRGRMRPVPASIALGGTARVFAVNPFVAFGGMLRGTLEPVRWIVVSLEATLEAGSASVPLGTADVLLASGAAAFAHPFGAAPRFEVGAGARIGWASVGGTPAEGTQTVPGDIQGPWGGPMLVLASSVALGGWGRLRLGMESGYAVAAVRGTVNGTRGLDVGGVWLMSSLGIGIEP